MKFTALALFLAPLVLAQEPTTVGGSGLSKRAAISATVQVDGLRYRTCPKTSCSAPGQFAKGKRITLSCYTRDNTETINGDKGWAKVSSTPGKGNWVALAFGEYMSWTGQIPYC